MKPSEICEHAADLIDYWGWTTKQYQAPDGRMCIIGALQRAAQERPNPIDGPTVLTPLQRSFNALRHHLKVAPSHWNDFVAKDKTEVSAALRATAAKLRAQEAQP